MAEKAAEAGLSLSPKQALSNGMVSQSPRAGSPASPTAGKHVISVKNKQLERESTGCFSVIFYSSVFILMDVWRQVCAFGMKYFNDDRYPVPQTELVVLSELAKLVIFFTKMSAMGTVCSVNISLLYLIPSVTYAINNNIYFFALHYTTPPVWNILTQLRVVFTAFVYRFYFKKSFSAVQWTGLLLLVGAIVLAKFSGEQSAGDENAKSNMLMAMILAVIGSVIAAVGPIYTEYLFKNDDRSFDDKQLQLYLFGSICAGSLFFIETQTTDNDTFHVTGPKQLIVTLFGLSVFFSVACGISTAFIMKKLDNIVKLYAQALSNIVTAFASVFFFPRQFQFDSLFVVCLGLTILAIFMYENENLDLGSVMGKVCRLVEFISKSTLRTLLVITGICVLVMLLMLFYRLRVFALVLDNQEGAMLSTIRNSVAATVAQGNGTVT